MPGVQTTAELLAEIHDLRAALLDANDHCRSAFQVANKLAVQLGTHAHGANLGALADRLLESLVKQHAVILATGGYPSATKQEGE